MCAYCTNIYVTIEAVPISALVCIPSYLEIAHVLAQGYQVEPVALNAGHEVPRRAASQVHGKTLAPTHHALTQTQEDRCCN